VNSTPVPAASEPSSSPGFLRAVSRWQIVALSVNAAVGSGIYLVLPVATARLLGAASIWAIPAGGLAVLLVVLCFAAAASRFDRPGGAYLYAREAFGDFIGFEVGWMTWLARVASVASLTVFSARVLAEFWPAAGHGAGLAVTIIVELVLLTWINVVGIRAGARTTVVLTIGKLLPLVLLVGAGLFHVSWERVFPVTLPATANLCAAALLVLYSYSGFETVCAPAGEFQDPQRNLPFALVVQLVLITTLYTLVQLIAVGVVPNLGQSTTPLSDAGRILLGPTGAFLLTLGAAVSVLGTNNGTILSGPRYLYAMAESGRLPRAFARIHKRFHTPHVAILTQSALSLLLIGADAGIHSIWPTSFALAEELALISVIARLVSYLGTCLSVPMLETKLPPTSQTIRLPGGAAIPAAAVLVCTFLIAAVEPRVFAAGALSLAVGAGVYLLNGRRLANGRRR
jgi:basic amino acid/polyamine antiporter, APA family